MTATQLDDSVYMLIRAHGPVKMATLIDLLSEHELEVRTIERSLQRLRGRSRISYRRGIQGGWIIG